jgi:hypothetical protein
MSHVHPGQQEIIIPKSDFVDRHAVMAPPAFPTTKENKGAMSSELPLHYNYGITSIEDKQKKLRQNIFPLVWSGTFLQYGTISLILTFVIHLL